MAIPGRAERFVLDSQEVSKLARQIKTDETGPPPSSSAESGKAFGMSLEQFMEQWQALRPRLIGSIKRGYRRASGADIDDILQEIYIRAFRAIKKGGFEGRSSLYTWLSAIAAHAASDFYSRGSQARELPVGDTRLQNIADESESQIDALVRAQERERIKKALQQLPAKVRQAVELNVVDNLEVKDIAALLETRASIVRGRLWRGKKQLLELLEEKPSQKAA